MLLSRLRQLDFNLFAQKSVAGVFNSERKQESLANLKWQYVLHVFE